jgi:metallo-beta-lactamase family protein
MQLQFLGAATTVTGSQFLLTTDRAKILVDCGMFQGSPNESIRNRIPLAYDPATIDAILLTHAHLDHCGLIPYVVAQGYRGPIYATAGTAELARLVLLDSGKLQQEFAKRNQRWERRHPDKAVQEERDEQASFQRAMELAEEGAAGIDTTEAVEAQGGREVEDDEADAPLNRSASGASPAAGAGVLVTGPAEPAAGGPTGTAGPMGAVVPAATTGQAPAVSDPKAVLEAAEDLRSAVIVPDDHLLAADDWPPLDRDAVASGKAWVAPNPEVALRYQPPAVEVDLDEPLYDEQEAERALLQFKAVRYDDEVEVAPGIRATFVDAGHILGSAIICLRVSEGAREGPDGQASERRIVFSGDLGRRDTPIIRDPTVVTDADYVLVESTYGGREHEPQEESIRVLAETIQLVADHDGVLLVPSFAIGRTQEVVWQLDRLLEEGKIPALPLYLDSPMASKASDVYRHHPDYFDAETRRLLEEQDSPLDYPGQIITNDVQQSKAIARARRPYMIVASNGMLTGGRVVAHLRELIDDPRAVLLFVGYQGHGTLGAHLQAGATTVRLDGQIRTVRCQVRSISGFSAHADESELLDWVANFGRGKKPGDAGFPLRVFLVHGDPEAQRALEPKVRALGFASDIPKWHETVILD